MHMKWNRPQQSKEKTFSNKAKTLKNRSANEEKWKDMISMNSKAKNHSNNPLLSEIYNTNQPILLLQGRKTMRLSTSKAKFQVIDSIII